MIKCAIFIFCLITFCYSARLSGSYNELVLSQRFDTTGFFYYYNHLPYVNSDSNDYRNFMADHKSIFKEESWIVQSLLSYHSDLAVEPLGSCLDSSGQIPELNPNDLDPEFQEELKAKWPVRTIDRTQWNLWSIAYNVYGSCVIDQGKSYFQLGLTLHRAFNIGTILKNAKIIPGKSYEFNQIVDVIINALGKQAIIYCLTNIIDQKQYIFDVDICFDRSGTLKDCRRQPFEDDTNRCFPNKPLHYPLIPSEAVFPEDHRYCSLPSCPTRTHTLCKYPGSEPAPRCGNYFGKGLTLDEKRHILSIHNTLEYRVIWDEELESIAQRWANQCINTVDECRNVDRFDVRQRVHLDRSSNLREPSYFPTVSRWIYEERFHSLRSFILNDRSTNETAEIIADHLLRSGRLNEYRIGCGTLRTFHRRYEDLYIFQPEKR